MLKDSKITNNRGPRTGPETRPARSPGQQFLAVAATVAVVWAAGLLVGGCTSDPAGLVGANLIDNQIDSSLVSIDIVAIDAFSGIRVDNESITLPEQQALYMGSEVNTHASLIVNFDFGDTTIYEEFPEALFTSEEIKTVKLSLTKLLPYGATRDSFYTDPDTGETEEFTVPTGQPADLFYHVFELEESFDPADFEDYPTMTPPRLPSIINDDFFLINEEGLEPTLELPIGLLLRWVAERAKVGLMIQLGALSDSGLVGFASNDLTDFRQVPDLAVGSIVGPEIIIDFLSEEINLQIQGQDDVTVFDAVDPAAETVAEASGGFTLRTGLRSYPAFRFDLSVLPDNALINRAILSVTNDIGTSYGPTFSVQVSEIVADLMDDPARQLDVDTIGDDSQVYPLTFRSNLQAAVDSLIEFDITTGVRRAVNLVNETPRGFLLSGVENPGDFTFPNTPPDVTRPDFYYRQLNFAGLDDPDPAKRPFLRIWYSVVDDLSDGAK